MTGLSKTETRHALEALARAHLIEPGAAYGRWRMHDLIRLHSAYHGQATAGTDHRAQALNRLLDHYLGTTKAATFHLDPRIAYPTSHGFPSRDEALEWLKAEYANLTAATYRAAESGHLTIARDLPEALRPYLDYTRPPEWFSLAHASLAASHTLGDQRGQANALTSLGTYLRWTSPGIFRQQTSQRTEEAITNLENAVKIYRALGDRSGEACALDTLALALHDAGRFEEAIVAGQTAVELYHDLNDDHGEAQALNSLSVIGSALREPGRYEEAVTVCQQTAQHHHHLGLPGGYRRALINLGDALREAGHYEEAITVCQHAVELHDSSDYGMSDRESALSHLGSALLAAKRYNEAIAIFEHIVQNHPDDLVFDSDRAGALYHLGGALRQAGRYREAIATLQDAVQAFRSLNHHRPDRRSESHVGEGLSLAELGLTLRDAGHYNDAIATLQLAAEVLEDAREADGLRSLVLQHLRDVINTHGAA